MSPVQGYPINHSKQVVCIPRAASFRGREGKCPTYVHREKITEVKRGREIPSSPTAGKGKGSASGIMTYGVSKESFPSNQEKAPEMGQLLIEYNVNYSMHY